MGISYADVRREIRTRLVGMTVATILKQRRTALA